MNPVKALGSLPFAILLISSLAVLLTVSTLMESAYGTPFAQKIFYTAFWFDGLLALMALNLFCSALTRWPFKKHHAGFVITHIGIILLLGGALVSRMFGVEGQLQLFEGQEDNRILMEGRELVVKSPGGAFTADLGKMNPPFELKLPQAAGLSVRVERVLEHAAREEKFAEGGPADTPNRAVEASLSSAMAGVSEKIRLVEKNPDRPHSSFAEIGPARFELKPFTDESAAGAVLRVREKTSGREYTFAVTGDRAEASPLGSSGLTVSNVRYYPSAKVVDRKIVDSPADIRFNPAVEFEISDGQGRREEHTKFFLFPGYASLKGGAASDVFGLEVALDAEPPREAGMETPGFTFLYSPDGWRWRSVSSKSGATEGELKEGQKVRTGWMDMEIEVTGLYSRAKVSEQAVETPSGGAAAELLVRGADGAAAKRWLFSEAPLGLAATNGRAQISLVPKSKPVPFFLALSDFRKKNYPGTSNPASFESDVVLSDPESGLTLKKTISMNKPLDYKGWRIFQSSYLDDGHGGEGSVFTVAKNPGISLLYAGAIIILAGVLLLFYLHPFFTGRALVVAAGLFTALLAPGNAWASAADDVSHLPIQHNGRVKPLEAFARQTVKLLSDNERFEKRPALRTLFIALSDREKAANLRWIRVEFPALKETLGLDTSRHFFSLEEILPGREKIETLARQAKTNRDKDLRPSKLEQKAEQLWVKMRTAETLLSGDILKVVPQTGDAAWRSPLKAGVETAQAFEALADAYAEGSLDSATLDAWKRAAGTMSVPSWRLDLEVIYYRWKPFDWAAGAYLLGFFLLVFFRAIPGLGAAGRGLLVAALAFHTLGIALRVLILGRPPVSNMYESMIFMNWALMVFAAVFAAFRKNAVPLLAGSIVSALVMIYAGLLPLDGSLDVLVPVLRSNYWLSIHVMTVVSSYGAFGLAMGLSHRHLFLSVTRRFTAETETESADLIYRVIQLGVVLIGTGTFLGGVWANESWGRFWGWDPKETWALITFLGYLIVVHLRFTKRIGPFGTALAGVLGFELVLMTWYGVNFVLGRGLHTYGAGSGGMEWVVYFLVFEALFLGFVLFLKKKA